MNYLHFLQDRGVSLGHLGLPERALHRNDALQALELLSHANVPILGGDVYLLRGINVRLAYANWHADRGDGEPEDAYCKRSWPLAEEYIRTYPPPPADQVDVPIFVLVPKRRISRLGDGADSALGVVGVAFRKRPAINLLLHLFRRILSGDSHIAQLAVSDWQGERR